MKYIFLTDEFYEDYKNCAEIEQKRFRPYIMLLVKIDDMTFALPLRSHIKHKYSYITDKNNNCGVDYSKAVIILKEDYIDKNRKPILRENEHKALLGKEYIITKEFKKYLNDYKKAVSKNTERLNYMYKYCTLQYFNKELNL